MLDFQIADASLNCILACKVTDREFLELRRELFLACVNYSRIRTNWFLTERESRKMQDQYRTKAHNRVIDACNCLSRYMAGISEDNSWRRAIGDDRKNIGDFACYVHAYLGILAR